MEKSNLDNIRELTTKLTLRDKDLRAAFIEIRKILNTDQKDCDKVELIKIIIENAPKLH